MQCQRLVGEREKTVNLTLQLVPALPDVLYLDLKFRSWDKTIKNLAYSFHIGYTNAEQKSEETLHKPRYGVCRSHRDRF